MSPFLKSIAESFVFQANKKSQLLNIQISIEEHLYWYDADVLQKIVVNLLGNALKYSPEKAEIHVSANIGDGNLSLSVKNTGISLSKEMLNNIFDRFHRSHENEPGIKFNLACYACRLGDSDTALRYLLAAIALDSKYKEMAFADEDLNEVHEVLEKMWMTTQETGE